MRVRPRSLLVLAWLLGAASVSAGDQLRIEFQTLTYGGQFAPGHAVAVWIEDGAGRFVKTVELNAGVPNYAIYLTSWLAASDTNRVDAVTSASRMIHARHDLLWDCTDTAGAEVADGAYRLRLEYTENNAVGFTATYPFTKGNTSGTQTYPDDAHFTGVRTTFMNGSDDLVPPAIVRAGSVADPTHVTVVFSEPLDRTSAETVPNYTLSAGVVASAAQLQADTRTVVLTAPFVRGRTYVLSVSGVRDLAAPANTIAAGSSTAFVVFTPPVSGAVAWWPLDTVINGVSPEAMGSGVGVSLRGTSAAPGRVGGARQYTDTTQFGATDPSPGLAITGPLTVAAWIYPAVDNLDVTYVDASQQYTLWNQAVRELRLADTHGNFVDCSVGALTANQWNHVVGTFSGTAGATVTSGNARIYINGVPRSAQYSGTAWAPTTGFLANAVRVGAPRFIGMLDEVSIYNRSLSLAEVTTLYQYTGQTAVREAGPRQPLLNLAPTRPPARFDIRGRRLTLAACPAIAVTQDGRRVLAANISEGRVSCARP